MIINNIKQMNKLISLLAGMLALWATVYTAYAQTDYLNCGTTEKLNAIFVANPQLKQEYLQRESELAVLDQQMYVTGYNQSAKSQSVVYIIPVVFHVIHQGGSENISDEQIHDAVRILNEDFRKLNATAANTVSQFQSIAADCEIEFRLAQKDPSGNCTNGIDRIASIETNAADDDAKLNPWPRNKYLNIWTVKTIGSSGVAGYAYLPGTAFPSTVDGILILHNYVGSIGSGTPTRSHALTHEVGHFLNLNHTWGNTNDPGVDCSGSDNVSDTPPTKGWTTCNLAGATCGSPLDNVQNFMEYSYCPTMFTAGQKTRMHNALNSSSGQRNSLWTTSNLTNTGVNLPAILCKADFESNNAENTVCQGGSLTFSDLSWNGSPTAWNWSFPGGTPSTSNDSMPVVQYNTPGVYSVTLQVTRGSETASTTKNAYVTVNSSTAVYSVSFYSEGFEASGALPNTDWQVRNKQPGGNTWEQTGVAAATGTKSVRIVNTSASAGYVDELISPSVNMTTIAGTAPALTFKVASAQRSSSTEDKLQVYVSTNCGLSWVLRKTISGTALATANVQTASFIPTSSQWAEQSVILSSFVSQQNLYVMFRFTSDGGNNIYIDDINIRGNTTGIAEDELSNTLSFNVYPNPVEQSTVAYFNLLNKQQVQLAVYDMLGRKVADVVDSELSAGEHNFSVSQSNLLAGMYYATLTIDKQRFTKKLIVK